MRKVLAALMLALATSAHAQTPVSVRYQNTNPSLTLNCTPGQMVWNTLNFNPFLCNAPVDGTAPRFKSMLTAASAGFPITQVSGDLSVLVNGFAATPDAGAAYNVSHAGTGEFAGLSHSISPGGTLSQWVAGTPTNFYQHDISLTGTKVESTQQLTATAGSTRSITTYMSNSPSVTGAYSIALTGDTSKYTQFDLDAGELNMITQANGGGGPGTKNSNFNIIIRDGTGINNFFRATIADGNLTDGDAEVMVGTYNSFDVTEQDKAFGRFRISDAGQAHVVDSGATIKGAYDHTVGTKPTCDASARNSRWFVQGGAGVADSYEVCMKDAADSYAWKVLATP